MIYAQVFADYEDQLLAKGEEPESLAFVFRALKQLSLTDFLLLMRQEVSPEDQALLAELAGRLLAHEPAQYIIGYETFCDLTFKVDSRVLIPRPETAELVQLLLAENEEPNLALLDIGTGSGALAISLAHNRPSWQVTASDLSAEALELAQENADRNQVAVSFLQSDVFDQVKQVFDIIISNPPYIAESDKEEVGLNVLTSEPHLALFAEENGLAIYRRLAKAAPAHLKPQGKIYLEIGYKQGKVVSDLFRAAFPQKRVRLLQDQFGQDRMVVVDDG